jgi:hypothetical protein
MRVELKPLVWSAALALIQMVMAVEAAILQVGFLRFIGNRAISPVLPGGRISVGRRRVTDARGRAVARTNLTRTRPAGDHAEPNGKLMYRRTCHDQSSSW